MTAAAVVSLQLAGAVQLQSLSDSRNDIVWHSSRESQDALSDVGDGSLTRGKEKQKPLHL